MDLADMNDLNDAGVHVDDVPASECAEYGILMPEFVDPDTYGHSDCYTAIDERLAELVTTAPVPPDWYERWHHSTRGRGEGIDWNPDLQAEPEERLAVWQAIRDSGDLPADACLFLIADEIVRITNAQVSRRLEAIDRAVDALWADKGLKDWRDQTDWESQNYSEFSKRCPLEWEGHFIGTLTQYHENEIARLYRSDRKQLFARVRAGQAYFKPPPPAPLEDSQPKPAAAAVPKELRAFADELSAQGAIRLIAGTRPASATLQMIQEDECTHIEFFLNPMRVNGGPIDGARTFRHFEVCIESLRALFDEVAHCVWVAYADPRQLRIKGTWHGYQICLYVFDIPPYDVYQAVGLRLVKEISADG